MAGLALLMLALVAAVAVVVVLRRDAGEEVGDDVGEEVDPENAVDPEAAAESDDVLRIPFPREAETSMRHNEEAR